MTRFLNPKVSVLMPVYKTPEPYLRQAIESILGQTFDDFEFLILDDCPSSPVEGIVKTYNDKRIKYFKNDKNLGISPSRNKLIDLSKGQYLAVMDHDDVALSERLEKEVNFLDANPDVGVVGTWYETFPKKKLKKRFVVHAQIEKHLMFGCAVLHPSAMIRKSVLICNSIRYEAEFTPAEDYALWCRLIGKTKFANIPEVLQKYRDYPNNTSKTQAKKMKEASKQLHQILEKEHPQLMKEATTPERQSLKIFGIPLIKKKKSGGVSKYKILGFIKVRRQDPILYKDTSAIAIYIISFNRLYYLRQMIETLEKFHLYNIHIIDNASTYPPLLEYYKTTPYTVHRMNKNYGHMVFFDAPDFKSVRENEYCVVTDPDVMPIEECPTDFMDYFYQILQKYPKYNKVGFSLKIDDIDENTEYQKTLKKWETQFYKHKINFFKPYLYNSAIDTTFALYRPQKLWKTDNFFKAVRTGFPYQARHLPWYKDFNNPTDEDKFYLASDIGCGNWNDSEQTQKVNDRLCNLPEHFWQHLFSIKSSYRRTVIRFLGFKLTIKKT
ncbi:MAG: glycosyltransferase [Alphaproteobacteria bacterium]|nr:glycosyltransferase [Alphaproteobacteria bacterium]